MANYTDLLFVEKYRPKIIDDCVLSDSLKDYFKTMIEENTIQNMLFVGSPGTGKCLAGTEEIIIYGDDVLIEKLQKYLNNR